MTWYFLEVERYHEEILKNLLNQSGFRAFIPKKEMYFKKNDLMFLTQKLLFPGTVMVSSELSAIQFTEAINSWISLHEQSAESICKESNSYFHLSTLVQNKLENLMNDEYIILFSKGVIQNYILTVNQGPLKGHEKEIQKIKRHQRLATLPMQCCGQSIPIILGLEVTEKN